MVSADGRRTWRTTIQRVLPTFVVSRAAIWGVALLAIAVFGPVHLRGDVHLQHDLGPATDVWARWDSLSYLDIAHHGYSVPSSGAQTSAAFYPLYPGLVGGLGRVLGGHYVLAGILVSLAASLGSFALLSRLAQDQFGSTGSRRAVLYLAVFPMTVFLMGVYAEATFLFLALASFALAERRRFAACGAAAGLAMLTRPLGVALLPALALLAWRDARRGRALSGLAVAMPIFALYPLLLWWRLGDPWAFARVESAWHRHLSPLGPLGGIWDGLRAGWAGVRQLLAGSGGPVFWPSVHGTSAIGTAFTNLTYLGFLAVFVLLTVVVWRRFGAALGLFAAVSLAVPLSEPSTKWPLLSLPRFGLVVFPFFLALAYLGRRTWVHGTILVASVGLLGVVVVRWALWGWVS
jgi:hypothetical protein